MSEVVVHWVAALTDDQTLPQSFLESHSNGDVLGHYLVFASNCSVIRLLISWASSQDSWDILRVSKRICSLTFGFLIK